MQNGKRNNATGKAKIYIDTCVLQGILSKEAEDTVFLNGIKEKGWEIYTSIHTLMELLDVAKDRKFLIKTVFGKWQSVNFFLRNRDKKSLNINELEDVSQELNSFFIDHKFIVFGNITEDVWNDVKLIVEKSNLHYSDALHLAMARMWACHILVTHDQFFIREGNRILKEAGTYDEIRICDIDKVEEVIADLQKMKGMKRLQLNGRD